MSFQGCEVENEEKLFFSTLSGFSKIFLKVTMLNYVFNNLTGLIPATLLKTRFHYVSLYKIFQCIIEAGQGIAL